MQVDVRIGERRVIASGQLVLGPLEREIAFTVDGVDCAVTLSPIQDGGPFQVRFHRPHASRLEADVRGRFPEGAVSWTFNGLLQRPAGEVDLDLTVLSETADLVTVRRLQYTLTLRPSGSGGMLDPTSSAATPAPLPSSGPPFIPLRRS
jgi:hypothetical protein